MSKELEYIQNHIKIVRQQVNFSQVRFLITDPVKKTSYDFYENELQILESIEKSLHRLESIDNAEPSEALECLNKIVESFNETTTGMYGLGEVVVANDLIYGFKEEYNTIEQALLKAQEQEKENELLKEIIKSLFDRGCPLHQYTDKEGVLTIEVDDECSIMRLGEFKGFDLDKKLKEVLDNE